MKLLIEKINSEKNTLEKYRLNYLAIIQSLRNQRDNHIKNIIVLKEKIKQKELKEIADIEILGFKAKLMNNIIDMINSLPKNSPLRRPILCEVLKDVDDLQKSKFLVEDLKLNKKY